MLKTTIVLAVTMGLAGTTAIADDNRSVERSDIDVIRGANGLMMDTQEERFGEIEFATDGVVASQPGNAAANTTPQLSRVDTDVSGDSFLNHLGIGFAMGLRDSRIGPQFVFPNGKPGGSQLKPFTPLPGGDDGVIDDGGLNPGGGGINPGEGPCFNCTVNPSPDD